MEIWKLPIGIARRQTIKVPLNATFLHVAEQHNQPCVWFQCDPEGPTCERTLAIYSTGHQMGDNPQEYIGTVVDSDGFVWHVFEALS